VLAVALFLVLSPVRPVVAQQPPTPPPPAAAKPAAAAPARDSSARDKPPISPGRAFLYSALIPGLGQAALNRKYTGAAFFFVEAFSLSLLHRSADDLRVAKAFAGDSVPLRYDIDPATGIARRNGNGDPIVAQWQPSGYTSELVRARKLQVEDWVAVVIFNHLISGADAFVAANLWDLPQHVSMRAFPVRGGAGLVVSAAFR
jgi:hypothetical protein